MAIVGIPTPKPTPIATLSEIESGLGSELESVSELAVVGLEIELLVVVIATRLEGEMLGVVPNMVALGVLGAWVGVVFDNVVLTKNDVGAVGRRQPQTVEPS